MSEGRSRLFTSNRPQSRTMRLFRARFFSMTLLFVLCVTDFQCKAQPTEREEITSKGPTTETFKSAAQTSEKANTPRPDTESDSSDSDFFVPVNIFALAALAIVIVLTVINLVMCWKQSSKNRRGSVPTSRRSGTLSMGEWGVAMLGENEAAFKSTAGGGGGQNTDKQEGLEFKVSDPREASGPPQSDSNLPSAEVDKHQTNTEPPAQSTSKQVSSGPQEDVLKQSSKSPTEVDDILPPPLDQCGEPPEENDDVIPPPLDVKNGESPEETNDVIPPPSDAKSGESPEENDDVIPPPSDAKSGKSAEENDDVIPPPEDLPPPCD